MSMMRGHAPYARHSAPGERLCRSLAILPRRRKTIYHEKRKQRMWPTTERLKDESQLLLLMGLPAAMFWPLRLLFGFRACVSFTLTICLGRMADEERSKIATDPNQLLLQLTHRWGLSLSLRWQSDPHHNTTTASQTNTIDLLDTTQSKTDVSKQGLSVASKLSGKARR